MSNEQSNKIDPRPFTWALIIVAIFAAVWLTFRFFGEQRFHNTAVWQQWRPVVASSEPQTVQAVEVNDKLRNALSVAQTERGVYFLSGTKNQPGVGERVVVQANDHWEMYLCAESGDRCMTIHSFCEGAVWPNLVRDEQGRVEGCYAPGLGEASARAEPLEPEDQPRGPGKRFKRAPAAVGTAHPREWAWRMGLPKPLD